MSLVPAKSDTQTPGEILYLKGILPSGAPLTGSRAHAGSTSGQTAACVNCHRRSGLGTVEGRIVIPPITAKYLYQLALRSSSEHDTVRDEPAGRQRIAYTDATLARAIREGTGPDGHTLGYLMPRYALDDDTMASLIAYLKGLSSRRVPGVSADTLHFATIITPDADPVKRKGMLDVITRVFEVKNAYYRGSPPPLESSRRMTFRVRRNWQLHVWELTGAPETWLEQLHMRLRAEPVFAVISGLGGKNWAPVHQFCEQESIPCLLPNVELPIVAEGDFYDIYFSKGVLLEAQLMARRIQEISETDEIRRVVQVYREDDVGRAAARALRAEITSHGFAAVDRALDPGDARKEIGAALEDAGSSDALVFWLRPDDLKNLPVDPVSGPKVFVSGLMGGLEKAPLDEAWRGVVRMTYPFELPARRAARLNYVRGWFAIQRIPVVAEQTQVDTYIACSILTENLGNMLDNFVRDYLVENVEVMLSSRIVNGYYERLGLAPGQRFASKGGYIVRFAGQGPIPDGDWIVP